MLVAVSGGKDSLSLVCVLRELQKIAPVRFELGAATIDPQVFAQFASPTCSRFHMHEIVFFILSVLYASLQCMIHRN